MPDSECEIWCYEDPSGKAVSHRLDGDTLVLTHQRDGATIISTFALTDDAVEVRVEVTGPDAMSVKAVDGMNPCWQLGKSEAFGNRGDYVEDFVARCFVVLDDDVTLLKNTSGSLGRAAGRATKRTYRSLGSRNTTRPGGITPAIYLGSAATASTGLFTRSRDASRGTVSTSRHSRGRKRGRSVRSGTIVCTRARRSPNRTTRLPTASSLAAASTSWPTTLTPSWPRSIATSQTGPGRPIS